MTTQSPAPRRVKTPRWLDLRLIAGVVLVLASVAIGATVVASADSTVRMWQSSRNLSAGAVLSASDLSSVRVHLAAGSGAYLLATTPVVGQVLVRDVSAGELIPRSAIGTTAATTTVTVPLQAGEAPKLSRGERLQLWISTKSCPATVVLSDVTVQDVQSTGGGLAADGGQSAVVRVPPALAQRVVTALGISDATLRAGVVTGRSQPDSNESLPDLTNCGGTDS
ncbi:SAF domain-containing protein [Jatrophihabitans sp. GAS493]|uniref:SAF domain-containing protein n=1 Tax=Jatrophihabitans sp. GAS493 TaxID=1907575 RepID=UPI0012FDF69F|nr:SAF domain-containing protein [Jatrophihabitans sp. GAS493]